MFNHTQTHTPLCVAGHVPGDVLDAVLRRKKLIEVCDGRIKLIAQDLLMSSLLSFLTSNITRHVLIHNHNQVCSACVCEGPIRFIWTGKKNQPWHFWPISALQHIFDGDGVVGCMVKSVEGGWLACIHVFCIRISEMSVWVPQVSVPASTDSGPPWKRPERQMASPPLTPPVWCLENRSQIWTLQCLLKY